MNQGLTKNEKLTLWISSITGIVALVALFISFGANKISGDAYDLASRSYYDERRILLSTEPFDESGIRKGIFFKTIEECQQISNMTIFFPSKLNIRPIILTPPDFKFYQTNIEYDIREYLKQRIPSVSSYEVYAPHYPIQVFINVHGYTKGVSVLTNGVYELIFS